MRNDTEVVPYNSTHFRYAMQKDISVPLWSLYKGCHLRLYTVERSYPCGI